MVSIEKKDFQNMSQIDGFYHDKKCILINGNTITHNLEEKGIYIWSIQEAQQDPSVENLYASLRPLGKNVPAFESTEKGVCIVLAEKTHLHEPVYILHSETTANQVLQTTILASEFSKASFVEVFMSGGDIKSFTRTLAHRHADISHARIQFQKENTHHESVSLYQIHQDALIKSFNYSLSGTHITNHTEMNLVGEGARAVMDGIYIGKENQKIENYTMASHLVPHTESSENYKGILDGKSKGVFQGRVYVAKDAQKSNATQMNRNILLSKEASIDTAPELEILADDVKCSHGATIGKMDPDQIFYLQSRGLSRDQAQKMLIRAFVGEVIEKTGSVEFTDWMYEKVEGQLHAG